MEETFMRGAGADFAISLIVTEKNYITPLLDNEMRRSIY